MKKQVFIIILIGIATIPVTALKAQEDNNADTGSFESWNGLQVDYSLTKKIELIAEAQVRLKSYGDTYNQAFLELQSVYTPWKFVELGIGYRNVDDLDDNGKKQGHENFYRYHAYVEGKMSFNRMDFSTRIQHQTKREVNNDLSNKGNSYWRTKFNFKYNIRNWKLDPRVGIEFFMREEFNPNNAYDKYRASLGTKVDLKNKQSLLIKYLYEQEVNQPNAATGFHILSLRYGLSL